MEIHTIQYEKITYFSLGMSDDRDYIERLRIINIFMYFLYYMNNYGWCPGAEA